MDHEVKIDCAPVIIPTLCRAEHFKRCVESLKRNPYAKYTDLYIGLDYPAKESHVAGYNKIKEYLDSGIDGFRTVTIIRHEVNVGSSANARALKEKAFLTHDRYIFTEDDNEFSPNYLEYMNRCLVKYEDDPTVQAVTGYRYPSENRAITGNVFSSEVYYAAFGCGTWKSKMEKMYGMLTVPFCERIYKDSNFMKKLQRESKNQYCNFVKGMLGYTKLIQENQVWRCDMIYGIYMLSEGKKMVFPTISKVRNHGYDGSGLNCIVMKYDPAKKVTHRNFNPDAQMIDEEDTFPEIREENQLSRTEVEHIIDDFFEIPSKEFLRTKAAYLISRVIGLRNTRKLIQLIMKK